MERIFNILVGENFNDLRTKIANYPVETKTITDAISGKIPYNSGIAYNLIYTVFKTQGNDITGDVRRLTELLRQGYYKGLLNSYDEIMERFYELNKADIFTQYGIVKQQIDDYEYNYGWNVNNKFLFPCNNLGNYALYVIKKLMNSESIKEKIPNEEKRYRHIIEKQIYVVDEKAINNLCYSCTIDISDEFKKNIFTGDYCSNAFDRQMNEWKINRFDAVFGEAKAEGKQLPGKRSKNYVFQRYVIKSITLSKVTMLLTPSRWFQTQSGDFKYLQKFRERIRTSNHVSWLNYIPNSDENYTGGMSYIIYDNEYNGKCYYKNDKQVIDLNKFDIILTDSSFAKLISKITEKHENILSRYISSGWADIKTNDNRLIDSDNEDYSRVYISTRSRHPNKTDENYLWISNTNLNRNNKLIIGIEKWKVFTPETATSTGKGFSPTFIIGRPYEVCTQTYCGFLVNSEQEAISLISYLKTNFADKIVSVRKIKNHINEETLKWLPSIPLDQIWTDEKLFEYFKLNKIEKTLIDG